MSTHTSRCDRCGETVEDIDAGFSPGLHDCGGTWRIVEADDDDATCPVHGAGDEGRCNHCED